MLLLRPVPGSHKSQLPALVKQAHPEAPNMFIKYAVFSAWLVEVASARGSGSFSDSKHNDEKNGNLRPAVAGTAPDSTHRRLEDGLPLYDCEMGVCDAILDPATYPQFKTLDIAPLNKTNPFCVNFNNESDTEGFGPCPGHYDNIEVNVFGSPSPDYEINPLRGDFYLHVKDRSGGSLACGTGPEYTGDWSSVVNTKCYKLCFDVGLFYDGCYSTSQTGCKPGANGGFYKPDIYPTLILQGGAPNYYRAAFRANQHMTDPDGDSKGWRRVCAPLNPLSAEGKLPENEDGKWYMAAPNNILSGLPPVAGPPSPDTAWNDLLSDVTSIQLPVDFTSNPAERIGYDHICLEEGECEDTCDPEPLCYWKHEWKCENIKEEEWYLNFTKIVGHIDTFDSRHLCVCDVLNQCCPDLCDFAEQEFLALLLNVASGQVDLDCGVKDCDDCVYTVKETIKLVDELLALSSRSDYDCSRALQFLTGINQDEILCDSTGDCPQSKRCRLAQGRCVKKDVCETVQGVTCEDTYCEAHDCSCMIFDVATSSPTERPSPRPTERPSPRPTERPSPRPTERPSPRPSPVETQSPFSTPSPVSDQCNTNSECRIARGECVEQCIPSNTVKCDPDLCPEDECICKIDLGNNVCKQTELCKENKGKCVKEWDCVGICDDTLCDGRDDCTCQMEDTTPPCETNQQCEFTGTGGVCTRDCEPIPGLLQCASNVCEGRGCYCKNCLQNDNECNKRGGKCMLPELCEEAVFNDPTGLLGCHTEFCGGNTTECACLVSTPPCPLTSACKSVNGACVKDCVGTNEFACGAECNSEECSCLKCRPNDLCLAKNGQCVPFCVAGPGEVCNAQLCDSDNNLDNSPCACKYRLDIVSTTPDSVELPPGLQRIP